LATLQIRRELVDLARKHRGPESYAANHESNSTVVDSEVVMRVSYAADPYVHDPGVERWAAFHEAAAALPSGEREVFELAWFLGAEQVEVADHLGCSVRTVKRRWDAIKQTLRDALGADVPCIG
jgi:RNA polymerase sigma-70 factor (ECF subfamily)